MNLDTDELGVLADMLSAQKITALQEKLEAAEKDVDYWRERCERAELLHAATNLQNMYLTNYILLSAEKIKTFVSTLDGVAQWSFLRTFMQWSVPKEIEARELELINEVMPLPEGMKNVPTTFNNFESGSACQVFNDKVTGSFNDKENR